MQRLFHPQQLLGLLLFQLEERDPCHLGDHVGDVLLRDDWPALLLALLPLALRVLQQLPQPLLLFAELHGLLEVLQRDRHLLLARDLLQLLFHRPQIARQGVGLQLGPGPGLVDHVNGLVWEEPVGDVPIRQLDGFGDGLFGNLHPVVVLVAIAQALDDADGLFHAGLLHVDRLEAPLQRPVLLDVLAILVQGGRADALDLSARERGLQHVGRVDGPFRRPGPDQGVQLIDENDDVARLDDLLHHDLEAFLKLAAVLGAGHERAQVQRDDATVQEIVGHLRAHDPLGKALDDRRLAHAGFSDQHGVVLGPPAEDLQHPLDLVQPADDRIQRALLREMGEVSPELIQRRGIAFPVALPRRALPQERDGQLAGSQEIGAEAPENLPADAFFLAEQA